MNSALPLVAGALLLAGAARGEVLRVGPQEALTAPSAAARVAGDGDTIAIAPGEYFDCAVFPQNGLTITGPEDPATPAVITDMQCQGKAHFVLLGTGVTVRHITFTRARVGDGNGAGIRAEGPGLTVAHSRFVNNQSAIISVDRPGATIAILDSRFERNGAAGPPCVDTLQIGGAGLLRIERSVFAAGRACDTVRSYASRIEIVDSRFEDGDARVQVMQYGGALSVSGSVFMRAAGLVAIDLRGGSAAEVRGSVLENQAGQARTLLRFVGGTATMVDNRIGAGDVELDTSGAMQERLRGLGRSTIDFAKKVRRHLPF